MKTLSNNIDLIAAGVLAVAFLHNIIFYVIMGV